MTKDDAIEQLMKIKQDICEMEKFAGQRAAEVSIDKKVRFLTKYMAVDNLPKLFVKEAREVLGNVKIHKTKTN